MKRILLAVPIVFLACSVTRPTSLPTPSASEQGRTIYPTLLVTDSTGRARWVYDAWVERDTLRGLRGAEGSRERIALPMSQVMAVAVPHFSPARTVGLISGLVGVVVAAVLLGPNQVYSVGYR